MHPTTFLSCDWGSTSFRLRLARRDDAAELTEVRSTRGTSVLSAECAQSERPQAFAAALRDALDNLAALAPECATAEYAVLSGMVTSAHGWRELPYAETPCSLDGTGFVTAEAVLRWQGRDLPLAFVSGVRTADDVMRGEECELAGLLRHPEWPALAPEGEAVVLLPGTHSKHARVANGRLLGFRTFMTGELFDVLGHHSVLRHSLDPATPEIDEGGLTAGVGAVREDGLAATLFRVRTARLLRDAPPAWCRGFLSGALIGSELEGLHAASEPQCLVLCADTALTHAYRLAARCLGLERRMACLHPAEVARLSVFGHAACALPGFALSR